MSWSKFDDLPDPFFCYNGHVKMTELNIFHHASNILFLVWSTPVWQIGGVKREEEKGVKGERRREREGGKGGMKRKIKREEEKGFRSSFTFFLLFLLGKTWTCELEEQRRKSGWPLRGLWDLYYNKGVREYGPHVVQNWLLLLWNMAADRLGGSVGSSEIFTAP